ncbi:MAG: ABC transporter ATP-binding protein [Chloroflexota bacterium]
MTVISVEHLSKQYRLGQIGGRTLTEDLNRWWARVRGKPNPYLKIGQEDRSNREGEYIWALRDVSFTVEQGEVVGIIGRNGAGKSTLLKILSRITAPTEGRVKVKGRIASLLEVGTGFHPELTGRENIYLNGAILGMKTTEIDRKFDEIVDFAEIERFMDTPVKRYSSGMYVRLAFAVAAHLEPEILLVDEVLAVGDAEFQKKCLGKMGEVAREGRTVLFVSHNMAAVRNICKKGLILEKGVASSLGEINSIVDNYLSSLLYSENDETIETDSFIVNSVQIKSKTNLAIKTFDEVTIDVHFVAKTKIHDPGLYIGILSTDHQRLIGLDFKDHKTIEPIDVGQVCQMGFRIFDLPILPGKYVIEIYLKDMAFYKIELVPKSFTFEVVETPIYGGRKIDRWYGYFGLHVEANSKR